MAEEFKGLGNEALKNVQGVRDTMREIDLSVRDLNRQLSSTGQQASAVSTEFSAINTSAKKFADLQDQVSRSAKGTTDAIKEQQKQLNIVRSLNVRIDDLYREASKKTGEAAFNLKRQAENLSNARDNAKILADEYSTLAEDSAKLDKSTQFFGNLSKIVSEIPILGKFSKPFQEAAEAARKTVLENAKGAEIRNKLKGVTEAELKTGKGLNAERIKQLGLEDVVGKKRNSAAAQALRAAQATTQTSSAASAGFKALGSSMSKANIYVMAALALYKGIQAFIEASFAADKQAVSLQRSLQLNNEEANQLRNYFIDNKNLLETQYKLTKDLVEAQMQLSEMSAVANLYSLDAIDAQIQLTKEYKLSADEATKLNEIFISNGESSLQAIDNAKTVSAEFFKQTGLQIRQRDLLQQASKVSGFMLATFKGSSKALFEAVAKANQLGVELGKTESIAENLLNFEQSIEDEITAEMLTGKQINLDRARLLAINNDFAGATEEVLKNFKGIEEIQNMNFVTAQAVSKVTGLTKDELADAYRIQKLQGTEAGKQYERLKEAGLESQAQAILRGELNEAQIEQANKALDAQERFNIQLERAKEIFSDLVEGGVLQGLADALEALLNSSLIAPYREQGEAKRIAMELEAKQKEGINVDLSSAESASNQVTTGNYATGIGGSILAGAGVGAGIGAFGAGIGAIPGAIIGGLAGGLSSALGISMVDRYKEGQLEEARLEASRVGIRGYENSATNASSNNLQNQPIVIQNNITMDGEKVASNINRLPMLR